MRELGLIVSTQLAYGTCWSMFLLLPKFMTTELGASPSQIGLVSAIPSCAGALAVPFVGKMIDRVGRRPLILFGAAICTLQAVAFVGVDRIGPLLYALQLAYGLSFVIAFNAAGTHAADLAPPARLTQVLGLFGASNVITNAIAPAIGEPLASAWGWRPVFMLSAGFGLCAFLLALRLRDVEAPASEATAPPLTERPKIARLVLSMAGVGAAFAVAFAFYQPFALSLGMHEVRGFFIGFASSVAIARVLLGSLPDRLGRKRTAVAALALYALVEIAMTKLAPGTLELYGALLGLAHGFFYPAVNAIAVEQCDRRQRGSVMAYINGGFQIGYTLGVLAFGWVAERAGFPTIFVMGGAVAALAALNLLRDPPPAGATTR
jgi:MFS family permease